MKAHLGKWVAILALFICFMTFAAPVSGVTFLNSVPSNKGTTLKSDATLGYAFRVGGADLRVLKLGIWDQNADGLSESHEVGLWTSSGQLLVSINIPSGTTAELNGNFRYASLLESVTLSANTVYVIAARFYNIDNSDAYITGTYTLGPGVAWDASKDRYSSDYSGFVYPEFSDGVAANIGPNLSYDVVPEIVAEPGTPYMLSLGLLLLTLLRLQSRRFERKAVGNTGGHGGCE